MNVVVNGPRTAVATLKTVAVGVMVLVAVLWFTIRRRSFKLACNKLTCNFQVHDVRSQVEISKERIAAAEIFYLKGPPRALQFHAATSQSFPHPVTLTHLAIPSCTTSGTYASKETLVQLTVSAQKQAAFHVPGMIFSSFGKGGVQAFVRPFGKADHHYMSPADLWMPFFFTAVLGRQDGTDGSVVDSARPWQGQERL